MGGEENREGEVGEGTENNKRDRIEGAGRSGQPIPPVERPWICRPS